MADSVARAGVDPVLVGLHIGLTADPVAERALLLEAERLARMGSWSVDLVTGETYLSDALRKLAAVPPAATVADVLDMVHPDDRPMLEEFHALLLDPAVAQPIEMEIRDSTGQHTFLVRAAAVRGQRGQVIRLHGTVQDFTEVRALQQRQRSSETRMLRSSKRFTDLVATMPVGIGLFDEDERLIDANEALCTLLGFDLERLRGRSAEQLTHPDDRDGRHRAPGAERAERVFRTGPRVLHNSAGKSVYCELSSTVSVADDGQRFWLVVFSDVTDRRKTAERLRHQATHDELTGLPGRSAVMELLESLLGGQDHANIALLFCDVDNFKRFNDSLGHDVGDELIVALSRRLERGLPPSCTVGRISGDEYVVICSDVEEAGGVEALANQVAGLLRTQIPVRGQLLRVSATIGAAVPSSKDVTGTDLLRYADAAMFDAKNRGTGRVALASDALIATASSQLLLEGQLRDAIANDRLVLHYQPVVAADGTILSAEALVRWPHPDRGLLLPGKFLPVAEQGDLVGELDRWVLRTALREASGWPMVSGATLGGGVAVAINLAGLVPGEVDFVDVVSASVAAAGIAWDRVVLELVETSLIDLPSRGREAMAELAERGVRFAVDDFGTGYSSLARLKELPAQIIKIDRRFVSGVATDPSDFAVARAVVDLARAMGRSCVAEGVETATQFHRLRSVGVDAYQGWLLAKAVPADRFRELLARGPLPVPTG